VPPLREALHWAIPPVGLLAMSIGLSMGAVVLGQMLSHAFVRTA
jgi:hypothetical protein